MDHFEYLQDDLGQLPFLKSYSHLLLAFPLDERAHSRDRVRQSLTAAALKITQALPWLAGKVIQDEGLFKVQRCARWEPPHTIVRFRELDDRCASYDEIVQARGPISLLDGHLLAPRKAFPESYEETEADPAPVLAFQVNFIRGGLLVDCAAQHNLIDMSGIEQCYRLLATALRGEHFSTQAIEQGNRDRRTIVPHLGPTEPMLDHRNFKRPSTPIPTPAEPASRFAWRYFRFSRTRLDQIKRLALPAVPSDNAAAADDVRYISTNDALSAFCWQRITAVRLRRRKEPGAPTKFCRAINGRAAMDVGPEYLGDLVSIAMSRFTSGELVDAPLSTVAQAMRRDLSTVNNRYYIRSFASFIAREPDRSVISYGGAFNPDTDIGSSSWAHVQLHRVQFGVLGAPRLVRRPDFVPLKSDIYFMPQTAEGDIDALLCFNQADFDGLAQDAEWTSSAECIG